MTTITLIPGDGVGPEVTSSAKAIIDATGLKINWEICEAGAQVFKKGLATGVPQETIDSIVKNKIALKGPLTTPIGFGEKSANVTLRKMFETFGNIRPIREFPGVTTPYSGRNIDLVIVRENVEDLYAGIEHMQTPNVAQCLKLISRGGCEKIVRLAFEFARSEGRKTVHCAHKANIMKLTEGMLKNTFDDIASEYPDIVAENIIVDNCAHQLVKKPEQFDVIVTTNMNGDILSDLTSALVGGLGFAPSANIASDLAIFEAVHGSAPKYVGLDIINPIALILSSVQMLRYIGHFEQAELIEQSLWYTCAIDKVKLRDMDPSNFVKTSEFTQKVIANLGKKYSNQAPRNYKKLEVNVNNVPTAPIVPLQRKVVGIDVFIEFVGDVSKLGQQLTASALQFGFNLKGISCRGSQVYPATSGINPALTDQLSLRYLSENINDASVGSLLNNISQSCQWTHLEKLHEFDGKLAFTKAHGES